MNMYLKCMKTLGSSFYKWNVRVKEGTKPASCMEIISTVWNGEYFYITVCLLMHIHCNQLLSLHNCNTCWYTSWHVNDSLQLLIVHKTIVDHVAMKLWGKITHWYIYMLANSYIATNVTYILANCSMYTRHAPQESLGWNFHLHSAICILK